MWGRSKTTGHVLLTSWYLVLPDAAVLTGENLREWVRRWAREGAPSAIAADEAEKNMLARVARAAPAIGPTSMAVLCLKREGQAWRPWTRPSFTEG
jgi:hypothetical protein